MTTDQDSLFLERLKHHPELLRRFESILDVAEAKGDGPDTADTVEAKVVAEVRKLGAEVMTDWGRDKAIKETKTLRSSDPKMRSYKKKRSLGTQPSVP